MLKNHLLTIEELPVFGVSFSLEKKEFCKEKSDFIDSRKKLNS